MPDIEKVIKGLECHQNPHGCPECPYLTHETPLKDCDDDKLIADAIALLREQEPMKPTVDTRDGWCWYRCGKCGNLLASGAGERGVRSFGTSKYPVYCECCGKKVNWNA